MKYRNGEEVKAGDVIRWNCWDGDDNTTWSFTGLVKDEFVLYLGGGIDFGSAIGKRIEFDEVELESENNDATDKGIEKVCSAYDLMRCIANLPAPPQACT